MTVTKPIDSTVADLVLRLDESAAEFFSERCSIREFDGGYSRAHAEALGLLDVVNRYPEALSGVTVFAIELEGTTHWVVTTDRDFTHSALVRRSTKEARPGRLAEVVRKAFDGKALLSAVDPAVHV